MIQKRTDIDEKDWKKGIDRERDRCHRTIRREHVKLRCTNLLSVVENVETENAFLRWGEGKVHGSHGFGEGEGVAHDEGTFARRRGEEEECCLLREFIKRVLPRLLANSERKIFRENLNRTLRAMHLNNNILHVQILILVRLLAVRILGKRRRKEISNATMPKATISMGMHCRDK